MIKTEGLDEESSIYYNRCNEVDEGEDKQMNKRKFIAMGLMSLMLLVGCNNTSETVSQVAAVNAEQGNIQGNEAVLRNAAELEAEPEVAAEVVEEVDPILQIQENVESQITKLVSLIGKNAPESREIFGEPSSSKNLEETEVLLVDYYKVDYFDEVAKVEVVYSTDEQKVNFVSFTILQADDVQGTKDHFVTALTTLYGESSIERIVDKKGKRNINWTDGVNVFDLKFTDVNISLDIYEADQK